jgi:hypothetical protein
MALAGAGGATARDGEAFLTGAIVMATFVAACCSSPQTAEINADKRAETLMKWVYVGLATGAIVDITAAVYDPSHAKPILAGGAMAGTAFYLFYAHAKYSGTANPGPSTES